MKHSALRNVGAFLLITGVVFAIPAYAEDKSGPQTIKNPQDVDKQMGMMQETMLKMHEQMHKIMDAKNLQDRDRLKQEHREIMHQHMQAMKDGGMMGRGMMGGAAKSGEGTGAGKE